MCVTLCSTVCTVYNYRMKNTTKIRSDLYSLCFNHIQMIHPSVIHQICELGLPAIIDRAETWEVAALRVGVS